MRVYIFLCGISFYVGVPYYFDHMTDLHCSLMSSFMKAKLAIPIAIVAVSLSNMANRSNTTMTVKVGDLSNALALAVQQAIQQPTTEGTPTTTSGHGPVLNHKSCSTSVATPTLRSR